MIKSTSWPRSTCHANNHYIVPGQSLSGVDTVNQHGQRVWSTGFEADKAEKLFCDCHLRTELAITLVWPSVSTTNNRAKRQGPPWGAWLNLYFIRHCWPNQSYASPVKLSRNTRSTMWNMGRVRKTKEQSPTPNQSFYRPWIFQVISNNRAIGGCHDHRPRPSLSVQ